MSSRRSQSERSGVASHQIRDIQPSRTNPSTKNKITQIEKRLDLYQVRDRRLRKEFSVGWSRSAYLVVQDSSDPTSARSRVRMEDEVTAVLRLGRWQPCFELVAVRTERDERIHDGSVRPQRWHDHIASTL